MKATVVARIQRLAELFSGLTEKEEMDLLLDAEEYMQALRRTPVNGRYEHELTRLLWVDHTSPLAYQVAREMYFLKDCMRNCRF